MKDVYHQQYKLKGFKPSRTVLKPSRKVVEVVSFQHAQSALNKHGLWCRSSSAFGIGVPKFVTAYLLLRIRSHYIHGQIQIIHLDRSLKSKL